MTIVIAWTEEEQEIAPGQKPWRHDLGERPKLVDVKKPRAVVWLNDGSDADAVKAREYVKKEHPVVGRVFLYPTTERDPLGKARREIMETWSTAPGRKHKHKPGVACAKCGV
jgi:hypothetical protein